MCNLINVGLEEFHTYLQNTIFLESKIISIDIYFLFFQHFSRTKKRKESHFFIYYSQYKKFHFFMCFVCQRAYFKIKFQN